MNYIKSLGYYLINNNYFLQWLHFCGDICGCPEHIHPQWLLICIYTSHCLLVFNSSVNFYIYLIKYHREGNPRRAPGVSSPRVSSTQQSRFSQMIIKTLPIATTSIEHAHIRKQSAFKIILPNGHQIRHSYCTLVIHAVQICHKIVHILCKC